MSLYSELFYAKEINELFSDNQTINAFLQFEASLALAQADNGIIPAEAAKIIAQCCNASFIDTEKLKKEISLGGNAAIPLVQQLTRIVKNNDFEASKYVHLGATSQDVVDTALVLQIKRFIIWLEEQLKKLTQVLTTITQQHRTTLMIGRTLLQQARPITFGLKTAKWLENIETDKVRIEACKNRVLVLKLGGAVGSGNGNISLEVQKSMSNALGIGLPEMNNGLVELATTLGILSGNIGKIARDISLLMQTEIAEVFEGAAEGKGGSSTMPHKRNPVTSATIIANATRIPHLVGSMLSSMTQEHERSAGLWHSEWEPITQIIQLTAGSIEKTIDLLANLEVDSNRMLANIELTNGLIYAENVSLALAQKMGKINAHELIEKACKLSVSQGKHLKVVLAEMNIDIPDVDELFKPENSIGNSLEIIDNILSKF
jgi:3-carboxy-cis,cis-muconate cycloisomerase